MGRKVKAESGTVSLTATYRSDKGGHGTVWAKGRLICGTSQIDDMIEALRKIKEIQNG